MLNRIKLKNVILRNHCDSIGVINYWLIPILLETPWIMSRNINDMLVRKNSVKKSIKLDSYLALKYY